MKKKETNKEKRITINTSISEIHSITINTSISEIHSICHIFKTNLFETEGVFDFGAHSLNESEIHSICHIRV